MQREKLQEMIVKFRVICASNPMELYAAGFEDNEYFHTLASLIETILA